MPRKVIGTFEVEYVEVLDKDGNLDRELAPDLPEDKVKEIYHLMMLVRAFDEKLFKLQRSGKIGTYAEVRGEEASEVGSAYALDKSDWMVPSFRETGAYVTRGVDRASIVQSWKGDVRAFGNDPASRDLPVAIPVASQTLHAVGLAWASKLRKETSAALVYFGDGASSEGDFLEAMNFAGVFKIPIIFFCQNNQWAISTSRKVQTAADTIAQKAIGAGIKGVQVDGNDVLAVYKVTKEALERARRGEGPTLIESITYRLGDHTTSDDASKYRTEEELKFWQERDPLARLRRYFEKIGTWTDEYGEWVKQEVTKEVDDAVDRAGKISPPGPDELFDHVYASLPQELKDQKKMLEEEVSARVGGGSND